MKYIATFRFPSSSMSGSRWLIAYLRSASLSDLALSLGAVLVSAGLGTSMTVRLGASTIQFFGSPPFLNSPSGPLFLNLWGDGRGGFDAGCWRPLVSVRLATWAILPTS